MKQPLNKFFLKDPLKWQFWVLVAFLCKALFFIFQLYRNDLHPLPGFIGVVTGDAPTYFYPIDDLVANSSYSPDFRMPGYGILYLPFAFLFSKAVAYNILIVIQLILASISIYLLALIAKYLFRSSAIFYLTFYFYAISTYTSLFDPALYTESFATSFLILAVFYLLKTLEHESKRPLNIFLSGIFLTEVIFLRPVFMPLVILFSAVLFAYYCRQHQIKNAFSKLFIVLLPFLVCEGAWITRNFIRHNKFIPATTSLYYPEIQNSIYMPFFTLVGAWGGSDQHWDPGTDIRWFGLMDDTHTILDTTNARLPDYIYTSQFNRDSLVILKKQLAIYLSDEFNPNADSTKTKQLFAAINAKCLLYASSIKHEKPFLYYVKAPLMRTKCFLMHSGTYNLFRTATNKLSLLPYSIKLFYSILYLLIIGFGIIGILLLSRRSLMLMPVLITTCIVVYTVLIHPIILGKCEKRYFVPAYPFMLLCATYAITWIYNKISGRAIN